MYQCTEWGINILIIMCVKYRLDLLADISV